MAFLWLRRAADQGFAQAMYLLSVRDVSADKRREWARRAAEADAKDGLSETRIKARQVYWDAVRAHTDGDASFSAKNAAASKAIKAALKEADAQADQASKPVSDRYSRDLLSPQLDSLRLNRACGACGKSCEEAGAKLKTCGRCQAAYFCSRECQKRAWPEHKEECERLAAERKQAANQGSRV